MAPEVLVGQVGWPQNTSDLNLVVNGESRDRIADHRRVVLDVQLRTHS